MAYWRTPKMASRLAETREGIIAATLRVVWKCGYADTTVAGIAAEAGVATGLIYKHFPSKDDLFDEVFQRISTREIAACSAAASRIGTAADRISRVVETFARRAFKGRRLAVALLVESAGQAVEADRLKFRRPYQDIFADIIRSGVLAGELPDQDAELVAAALVGGIVECLIGPLSKAENSEIDAVIATLRAFCVRASGGQPHVTRSSAIVVA